MEILTFLLAVISFVVIFVVRSFTNKSVSIPQANNAEASNSHENKPKGTKNSSPSSGYNSNAIGSCGEECSCKGEENETTGIKKELKVLYGTQTGTAKLWAEKMAKDIEEIGFKADVIDLAKYDPDELAYESLVLFVISTYTDGNPPENCAPFYEWLKDHSLDFRVSKTAYAGVQYAVFGIGNSVYGKGFNGTAKELDRMMKRLSAQQIIPVGAGDNGAGVEISEGYNKWIQQLLIALQNLQSKKNIPPKKTKLSEEPDEDSEVEEGEGEPLVDLEDMGQMMKKESTKKVTNKATPQNLKEDDDDDDDDDGELPKDGIIREMLTPSLRKALTKQGYKLLGSHSGVKMCRWTKAMLRGRGGCYKHTFYGIQSYQCMEMTPSLACANKCVFCWRHHKNPVGKEWKWKVDAPEELVETAISNHRAMIKQMKGVPGVDKDRLEEAFTIRHCALSLVGEPIIYPYINEFLDLLHSKNISSFLVTNAQFPDKIDSVKPVTQLYVSVDAATKESLKKVDRPIFTDFWDRFLASLHSLSKKGQRTVYRLTLIKEWNVEELNNYAELVSIGQPSFIEIKGVTYCGTSKASNLTMKNVPFHEEVVKFSEDLCNVTPFLRENYELACEHEHSCCVLISHKKFKVNGKWNTWIDYPKFHELVSSGKTFDATDYMAETPSWALKDSPERGFDPEETRFKRNKPYQKGGC